MMSGGGRHLDSGSSVLWNFDGMRPQGVGDEGLRGLLAWPYRDLRIPPPDSPAAMTGEGPGPSASLVSIRGGGIVRCQALEGGWGVGLWTSLCCEAEAVQVPSKYCLRSRSFSWYGKREACSHWNRG